MRTVLSFDDVLLVPGYSEIESRSEVSLRTAVAGILLELPIFAANMPSICESDMIKALGSCGGVGIAHRMQSIKDQCKQVNDTASWLCGGAIGIGDDWLERAEGLVANKVNFVCLDVAHGHQHRVMDVVAILLNRFKNISFIIGNIATANAARYFVREIPEKYHLRVALKVGVGGGSVCNTRVKTGCGIPTFQSIVDVNEVLDEEMSLMTIIADGGFRSSGDIVKALAAGANAVMLGSLLAGTHETPGDIIKDDKTGFKYKVYRGAASYGAKKEFFGEAEYIEGTERLVPYRGSVSKTLSSLQDGIKSGFSYCGVDNIVDLQEAAEFVRITEAGYKESLPHGLLK